MAKKATKQIEPTQDDKLQEIGRRAFESIAAMVERLDAMTKVSECCADVVEPDAKDAALYVCMTCEKLCELADGEPDDDAREKARQDIQEDALSVQVRSGWYSPGEPGVTPEEFELLLATGGPAVRIVGELAWGAPTRARLEAQDWGTPWTEYRGAWDNGGADTLLAYAQCSYFGEG